MSRSNSALMAIARCGRQYRDEAMAAFGLRGCHVGYLTRICANPGVCQDQLAKQMLLNKSNVARQAAVLEEQGYITRVSSDADKRMLLLYPTEKAQQLLPKLQEIVAGWDGIISRDMTEEELKTLTRLLGKMRSNAALWMEER